MTRRFLQTRGTAASLVASTSSRRSILLGRGASPGSRPLAAATVPGWFGVAFQSTPALCWPCKSVSGVQFFWRRREALKQEWLCGRHEFVGVPAEFEACTSESEACTGEPRGLAFSWRTMAGSGASAL